MMALTLTWAAPGLATPPVPLRPVPLRPVSPSGEQPRIARDQLAYRVHPGETASGSIHVSNDTRLPARVTLFPVDAIIARDGNVHYRAPLAPRRNVGAWITLRTTTFRLRPGEGRIVDFRFTVPRGVATARYLGGILAQTTPIPTPPGTTGQKRSHAGTAGSAASRSRLSGVPVEVNVVSVRSGGPPPGPTPGPTPIPVSNGCVGVLRSPGVGPPPTPPVPLAPAVVRGEGPPRHQRGARGQLWRAPASPGPVPPPAPPPSPGPVPGPRAIPAPVCIRPVAAPAIAPGSGPRTPAVPSVVVNNTLEGGTSGTAVTTGNSSGASGNAFDTVVIGSGEVVQYDTAHAAHGSLAVQISTDVTAGFADVNWNTSVGTQTEIWGRTYLYATVTNQDVELIRIRNGASRVASVNVTTTGKVALVNAAGTTVATGATTIATSQWIRIDFHVIANASTGTLEAKLFNSADSNTATETLSVTNTNTGTQFTGYDFGQTAAVANIGPFWIDDLQINNTGWPGPSGFPSVVANNTFDGGTSGTTISTANSGGASGDAWDSVQIDAGSVAQYDTAHVAHGSQSGKFSTNATTTISDVGWTTRIGTQAEMWGRLYLYYTSNAAELNLVRIFNGGTRVAAFNVQTTGKLLVVNAAGTTVATSTNSVTLNQWVRIEVHIIANATTGTIEAKLFNTPDSASATETLSVTNTNTGAQFTGYHVGVTRAVAAEGPFWLDDVQINNTGWPGPSGYAAVVANNTFEGGTNGTTITTANSGGASGSAFDSVQIDAGSVARFDNAHAAHGTLAGDFSNTTINNLATVRWNTRIGTQTEIWGRLYYYNTVNNVEADVFRALNGSTRMAAVSVDASGHLALVNAAGTGIATGTVTVPANQWVRVEFHVIANATTGTFDARLFTTADGTSAAETLSVSSTNTGAQFTDYVFGATRTPVVEGPYWLDDLQINNTGWPGPNSTTNVVADNTFEGGTNGTTISTANSGGVSGDAWDTVSIGSGATATYDTSGGSHGQVSGSFTTGATAATDLVEWGTRVATQTEIWGRVYYFDNVNNVNARPIRVFNGAGLAGAVDIDTSGHVFLVNSAAAAVATGTVAVPASKWFRIEFHMIAGATTGTIEAKLFTDADSSTPDETLTATNTNMNTQFTKYDFGLTVSIANMSFRMDDIEVNTTGWPGPSDSAGSRSVSAPATASLSITLNGSDQTPTFTLPLSVNDTTGTGAGWNLTITATQFTNGAGKTLSTTASTVTAVSVTCSSSCVAPVNSVAYPVTVPAGAGPPASVKFYDAALGTGMGTFTVTPTIQVSIPANSYSGVYTCTVTVLIASGA